MRKKITIKIDSTLLEASKTHAQGKGMPLSAFIRSLLSGVTGVESGVLDRGRPALPWIVVRTAFHGGGIVSRHKTHREADRARSRYQKDRPKCICGCAVIVAFRDYDDLPVLTPHSSSMSPVRR